MDLRNDLLHYRVVDTGPGIAQDRFETVFTEFRQADATVAGQFGGTGLGLSITKKFVELHGGRIGVESELGMSAKTILYVEDNELNRKIVRDLLRRTSYRLIEAADGEAGIATALEQRPDLILMDLQLPKVSGLDAVRTLRSAAATADTPIIAITSFALSGDQQKAKDAGASAYLAKPYSPFDLLSMIRSLTPET